MKNLLHRIPMSRKFMLALALPLLVLLWLAGSGILERQQFASNMADMQRLTDLAYASGSLVHELQVERGMSVGFLSSRGERFATQLPEQRSQVDGRLASFRSFAAETEAMSADPRVADYVRAIEQRLADIVRLRPGIDRLEVNQAEVIETYTGLVEGLLGLVGRISSFTNEGRVSSRLAAYHALQSLKETAGVERAVLTQAFSSNAMSNEAYQQFVLLLGEEEAFMKSFQALANDALVELLAAAMTHEEAALLEMMRRIALTRGINGGYSLDPQRWFETQTRKINRLNDVAVTQIASVREQAAELSAAARNALILYVVATLLSVLAAVAFSVAIVRSIVLPLRAALTSIQTRDGDLTQRLAVPGSDELSQLYAGFNESTAHMEALVANIQRGALGVGSASSEIAQGNEDLASRTEEQSSSLVETATSMEQITSTVRQSADSARQAQSMTEEAAARAEQGSQVADQARQAMQGIFEANRQITAIVEAIDSIAFQTNLLALNASVEAARAGEHGRGFAVVAGEVRKLASRSAEEAERIRQLVSNNAKRVEVGNGLVGQTHEALAEITRSVRHVANLVSDMSAATTEQSAGIEQINQAVAQLEETTQQNAALVEQVAAASRSLDEQAGVMAELTSRFRVSGARASIVSGPVVALSRDPAPRLAQLA